MNDPNTPSEKHQNAIFEAAPIGMAIASPKGIILQVNEAFCNTTGYQPNDLINKSFEWFTHPDDLESNKDRNKQIITGKIDSHQMEKRYFHKDGSIIHIILKVTSLNDADGKVEFLLAQIVDISDKVYAAKEKDRSEKYFRQIFNEAPIGIAMTDINLQFTKVNTALCKLLGYSKEELLKLNIRDITHPEDFSLNKQKDSDLIIGKDKSFLMEKRYLRKDKSVIEGMLQVNVIRDEQGNIEHLLGQVVDISRLKNYEKLLESNIAQLLKANKELDKFVYHASHDLKGPLATIQGLCALHASGINAEKLFIKLQQPVEKMENVINILADFTENTDKKVKEEAINLKDFVDSLMTKFKQAAEAKNIELLSNSFSQTIHINSKALSIILKHLVGNALQYHCKKEKGYIKISLKAEDGILKIEIADNGPGIDDSIKDRVFEMFYRGHESSQGSGMGLYLVKDAVEKMKGEINFISEQNKGTKFLIKLPLIASKN